MPHTPSGSLDVWVEAQPQKLVWQTFEAIEELSLVGRRLRVLVQLRCPFVQRP